MIQCGHAHHDHQHEDFIAIVERACKAKGLRLTEIRKRVLQLVAAEDKPVKAYDLLSQLGDERGRSTAPPTVYRALEFLLEHGFVHKIESLNAFVSCPHPQQPHRTQFLICDACQLTVELDDPVLDRQLQEQARKQGFQADRQLVEVHGLCAQCQS